MKKRWIDDVSVLLLLFIAVFSLVSLMADSFSCISGATLYLWLAAVCCILWGAACFRHGVIFALPVLAGTLFAAYRIYQEDPVVELMDLSDRITGAFYEHVIMPGSSYPVTDTVSSHALILLFIGTILAAFLVVALSSRPYWPILSLLATLPLFAGCIVVNGEPPVLSCAGLVLFWVLIVVRGQGSPIEGAVGRTVLCALLPVGILLGGILLVQQPQDYVYTERDIELSRIFDRTQALFDLFRGGRSDQHAAISSEDGSGNSGGRSSFRCSWDSEDDRMDLTQSYDFDHADLPIFQVLAQTDGEIYLRTRSFGSYTGTGWLPAEELDHGSSLPFTAFAAEATPGSVRRELEIHSYADLGALCLPYWSAISSGSDAFVTDGGQADYRVAYTEYTGAIEGMRLPDEARGAESVYRTYAHEFYTQLPDSTRSWATLLCRDAGLDATREDIIEVVAVYVAAQGGYDLETRPYDSGDFARTFLTETHRGYCIHYATAAAVLYRAIGIPARVTEGFLVETRAGRFVDATAASGHAWVEIYRDGLGWIPVEVTNIAGIATIEEPPAPSASPEPTEAPLPSESPLPSATDGPEQSEGPEDEPGQEPTSSPDPDIAPQPIIEDHPRRPFPWTVLLSLLGLPLLVLLWYGLVRLHFLSSIRDRDGRRAAVACWRYAEKLGSYGAEMPSEILRIAEKAAFSPHLILHEEADVSRVALQELIDQIYPQLRPLQKLIFRFLRGLK